MHDNGHLEVVVVDGYFSVDATREAVTEVYHEYVDDFLRRAGHVFARTTPQPILEVARLIIAKCCKEHVVIEHAPLPAGPIVLAFTHNIPFVDAAGVLSHIARTHPQRELALVASMRTLARIIPGWAQENAGQYSIIEVGWESDGDGHPTASNGGVVVNTAIEFLQEGSDRILMIAPDGRLSLLRNGVLRKPFRGFDLIAYDAEATVVPVVTQARAKSIVECDFAQICTRFLPALQPGPGQLPSHLWADVVVRALRDESPCADEIYLR